MSKKGNAGSERARVQRLCDRTWNAAIELASGMAENRAREYRSSKELSLELEFTRLVLDLRAKKVQDV